MKQKEKLPGNKEDLIHVGKWVSLWRGGRLARAITYKNKRSEGSKYLRDSHISTSFLET